MLLVNITYFVDQNTNSQRGICKTLWPHASGISAVLSIEAFSLGNDLVHVQVVLEVPLTVQLWLQRMTMLSKNNLIKSLVVKYPYHIGYWKFQKDGIGQLHIF